MQKFLTAVLAAGLLVGAAPIAAHAQAKVAVEAKLATPVAAPLKVIVDGRQWRCAGDTCTGTEQGDSQSVKRECTRAAKAFGSQVVAYRNGPKTLSDADLAACNGADSAQTAQSGAPTAR